MKADKRAEKRKRQRENKKKKLAEKKADFILLVSAKSQKYRPYVSTILSDKHCGHIFKK